jgi:hypothetical protein
MENKMLRHKNYFESLMKAMHLSISRFLLFNLLYSASFRGAEFFLTYKHRISNKNKINIILK